MYPKGNLVVLIESKTSGETRINVWTPPIFCQPCLDRYFDEFMKLETTLGNLLPARTFGGDGEGRVSGESAHP